MQQPFPRIVEKATMLYPVLYSNNFILFVSRKAALSMNLKISRNKRSLTFVAFGRRTPFRDDRCSHEPPPLHYARPVAAKAVEASLSTFHFHLSTLTTFAVRNPRGATCSCTTRDLLLQRLSKLRFPLSTFIFPL